VHAFASLHAEPSGALGLVHVPVDGLHVPATLQTPDDTHVTGLPPTQAPAWQVSVSVHALPSLHDVPFATLGVEHTPVLGAQAPGDWHAPDAGQTTAVPPHTPDWHLSDVVQLRPSLQSVPLVATGFEHWPVAVLHVPAV